VRIIQYLQHINTFNNNTVSTSVRRQWQRQIKKSLKHFCIGKPVKILVIISYIAICPWRTQISRRSVLRFVCLITCIVVIVVVAVLRIHFPIFYCIHLQVRLVGFISFFIRPLWCSYYIIIFVSNCGLWTIRGYCWALVDDYLLFSRTTLVVIIITIVIFIVFSVLETFHWSTPKISTTKLYSTKWRSKDWLCC